MTDKPLVPPKTPTCQEYLTLYSKWAKSAMGGQAWMEAYNKMSEHRATCPLCQARMEEFNELARNAKETRVENER